MRAIFFVLLLMNVAFFANQFFLPEDASGSQSIRAADPVEDVSGGLKLLSEQDGVKLKRVAEQKGESAAAPKPIDVLGEKEGAAELCTMIGPYEQLLHAEYLVERLAALGAKAQITPVEIKEGDAYWVYLKPEMSEKEALRRLYELQKKQIESYIITKGELSNGISFGRYADMGEAEIRLNEIKKQGYEALIKTVPKTISETWVVLDTVSAEKIDETVWSELLNNQEGLEKRQNYCLGVASE